MNSNRTPDRVHVVKPPENENGDRAPSSNQTLEIIRMLAKIGDKLKRSEAERYELLAELREYRKSLRDLEDKADDSEKAYLAVENKINSSSAMDVSGEVSQRQMRFEKSLRATEDKMLKSIAGQALMDKRLQDTETKQTVMDDRLDESVREQAKINRKVDVALQDKVRLMRKVERLEEIVLETQNLIGKKSTQPLLADQTVEKKYEATLSAPVWDDKAKVKNPLDTEDQQESRKPKFFTKFFTMQNISTAAVVAAALLLGWSISQMVDTKQKDSTGVEEAPETPLDVPQGVDSTSLPKMNILNSGSSAIPVSSTVLDYSDEDLLDALNSDPDALAAKLNALEPGAAEDSKQPIARNSAVEKTSSSRPAIEEPSITPMLKNFDKIAYRQDEKLAQKIQSEKGTLSLTDRIQANDKLPSSIKPLENQAFAGNAEAQHDLAAIYTAGYAGVEQNFDKAALWLREAASNGVANARYNLGVLNHQGLGRERNLSRALYWYKEAASLGHAEAQYNLGIAYIEGIGTQHDTALAAAFFEQAANNGIVEAAYNLGLIHDNGLLGTSKADEAFLWYRIAADKGNVEATQALKQLSASLQMSDKDVDNLFNRMQQIYESQNGKRAGGVPKAEKIAQKFTVDKGLIKQVQEYLMLTGTYAGPADGINGKGTQASIRSYQATNDIPVDGKVTEKLVRSMIGGARETLEKASNEAL